MMKNLGLPLSNEALLSLKGGIGLGYTCYCPELGFSYQVDGPFDTWTSAVATLQSECNGTPGYCEANGPH